MAPYQLGVDLGTTYTAAAVGSGVDAKMAVLGTRLPEVPSVLAFLDDGTVLTGEAAERRALSEPDQIIREFKRRFGDPTPLVIGGVARSAESITATLLRSVVDVVSTQQGAGPDRIVLTHPASWSIYRMDLYRQIVLLADLDNVVFLSEPEAAARYYSAETAIQSGAIALVFDFGGGTFDSAVLRASGQGFEILGDSKGLERLGGIDIDHVVFQHVLQSIDLDLTSLDDTPQVRSAVGRLRADCVAAKEALSADTVAVVPVMLPGIHTDVRLTRAEFESMIRPLVLDTVTVVRSTVASAGLGVDAIDRVLLVGGSSRIPLVSQILAEQLQRPVHSDIHPKHTVALGAALYESVPATVGSTPSAVEALASEPVPRPLPPVVAPAPGLQEAAAPWPEEPGIAHLPAQEPAFGQPTVDALTDQGTPLAPPTTGQVKARPKWQRWAIPAVALVLVASAVVWLSNDLRGGTTSAASLLGSVADDSNAAPASTAPSSNADSSAESEASAAGSASTDGDGSADPSDLAGGTLPFRVAEGNPLSISGGVDVVGLSSQFAFGFDIEDSWASAADVIVLDHLGVEVTRIPTGDVFVTRVLDLGSEVWLSLANDSKILIFDTGCVCVSGEIAIGNNVSDMMFEHAGLVWVGDYDLQAKASLISVIDPSSHSIINTIDVSDGASSNRFQHGPVVVGDQLWAADSENMWTLDLTTQTVLARTELGGKELSDSVEIAGSVFVTDQSTGTLFAIDTTDFGVRSIDLVTPGDHYLPVSAPVVDTTAGLVWVSSDSAGALIAVDPVTLQEVHRLTVETPVGSVSIAQDHLFLPVGGNQLLVVDPDTGTVAATLPGAGPMDPGAEVPFSVVHLDSLLWLLPPFSTHEAKFYRLEPLG